MSTLEAGTDGSVAEPGVRRTVILLTVTILLLTAFVVAVTLGPGAAWAREGSPAGAVVTGLLVVAGLGAGFWALQSRHAPSEELVPAPRAAARLERGFRTVLARAQAAAGTVVLGIVALTDLPLFPEFGGPPRAGVRAILWAGLLASVVLTARRPTTAGAVDRWGRARVIVPFGTLALVLLLTTALGSATVGSQLLAEPLALVTATAVIVVPSSLILGATEDLGTTYARGERLWRVVERRPWTVLVLLGANLLVVVGLVVVDAAGWLSPAGFSSNVFTWSIAVVVVWFLLMVLTLDSRIALTLADQRLLGRIVVALVAIPTGLLVIGVMAYQFFTISLLSPVSFAVLSALVIAAAVVARAVPPVRFGRQGPRRVLGAAALLGAAVSLVAEALPGGLGLPEVAIPSAGLLSVVFLGGIAVGVVVTVVTVVVTRRPRVLLLLGLLLVWTFMAVFFGVSTATGTGILNLDLVLLLGLSVMATLWLLGRQHAVDGFEVALAVVVTATLWLAPVALRAVPDAYANWPLAVAFATPGVLSGWSTLRQLRGHDEPDLVRRLGGAALIYALVAALGWYVGPGAVELEDSLSGLVLDVVLMPLALLLILAGSAARRATLAPPTGFLPPGALPDGTLPNWGPPQTAPPNWPPPHPSVPPWTPPTGPPLTWGPPVGSPVAGPTPAPFPPPPPCSGPAGRPAVPPPAGPPSTAPPPPAPPPRD